MKIFEKLSVFSFRIYPRLQPHLSLSNIITVSFMPVESNQSLVITIIIRSRCKLFNLGLAKKKKKTLVIIFSIHISLSQLFLKNCDHCREPKNKIKMQIILSISG